ncbi:hypothetical protein EYF80_065122 [Liparis tanakae]|uniref:Uncharacterized protein n=1 Tax=Liparis tanakae TaxID=230148 RepID=A0A4Z2E7L6_9TELE|nr:hypothetical protein EYF80_065122 [Liparis tanakae]
MCQELSNWAMRSGAVQLGDAFRSCPTWRCVQELSNMAMRSGAVQLGDAFRSCPTGRCEVSPPQGRFRMEVSLVPRMEGAAPHAHHQEAEQRSDPLTSGPQDTDNEDTLKASRFPSMSPGVSRCLQVPLHVSRCLQMPPGSPPCLQMSPDVSRCLQVSPDVSRCLQVSPGVSRCLQMSPGVSRCLQMSPGVSRCLQMSPDVSSVSSSRQVAV